MGEYIKEVGTLKEAESTGQQRWEVIWAEGG